MNVGPRLVSELQRLTCLTCGVTFAVTKDYMYAQLSNCINVLICPSGHTTPFSNRMVDSSSVLLDMRRRVAQLEEELKRQGKRTVPLEAEKKYSPPEETWIPTFTTDKVEIKTPPKPAVPDRSVRKTKYEFVDAIEVAKVVQVDPPYLGFPGDEAPEKKIDPIADNEAKFPREPDKSQCPLCKGWFKKVRTHTREIHPKQYDPNMYPKGTP